MEIDTRYLYPVQASIEQWTDQRVITDVDLEGLILFVCYGQQVLSQSGLALKGWQFRQKGDQQLMTVKVREGDTPLVVFITGNSTTGCVSRFWNLYEDDRLSWVRDKYP